jgi:hypothetical protein
VQVFKVRDELYSSTIHKEIRLINQLFVYLVEASVLCIKLAVSILSSNNTDTDTDTDIEDSFGVGLGLGTSDSNRHGVPDESTSLSSISLSLLIADTAVRGVSVCLLGLMTQGNATWFETTSTTIDSDTRNYGDNSREEINQYMEQLGLDLGLGLLTLDTLTLTLTLTLGLLDHIPYHPNPNPKSNPRGERASKERLGLGLGVSPTLTLELVRQTTSSAAVGCVMCYNYAYTQKHGHTDRQPFTQRGDSNRHTEHALEAVLMQSVMRQAWGLIPPSLSNHLSSLQGMETNRY